MEPHRAGKFWQAGIVGTAGEQEHANAMLTTTFAEPLRKAWQSGWRSWISSFTKRRSPALIDVPPGLQGCPLRPFALRWNDDRCHFRSPMRS
ncbi:MAG: amino acid synthesis family protein [Burkholderiales bacterium]|nr:amino acid synthesis family protein [Burkholderiales bacterium]